MSYVLKAENVNFSYMDKPVLSNICTEIKRSEIMYILGANGAGKSTLLKIMCGILRPDSGCVSYEDKNIKDMSRAEIAKKIAYVSQENTFGFPFTVRDVVLLGRAPYIGRFEFEREEDLKIAEKAMKTVDIFHLSGRNIDRISGGKDSLFHLQEPSLKNQK